MVRPPSWSRPSAKSRSTVSASRVSSTPRASARAARAGVSGRASGAMSLRLPKATEWSRTRTFAPLAQRRLRARRGCSPSPRESRASSLKVSRVTPRSRIASNSGSIRRIAPRRSRCTRHRLTPWRDSWWAVASPNPLEPPRINAHDPSGSAIGIWNVPLPGPSSPEPVNPARRQRPDKHVGCVGPPRSRPWPTRGSETGSTARRLAPEGRRVCHRCAIFAGLPVRPRIDGEGPRRRAIRATVPLNFPNHNQTGVFHETEPGLRRGCRVSCRIRGGRPGLTDVSCRHLLQVRHVDRGTRRRDLQGDGRTGRPEAGRRGQAARGPATPATGWAASGVAWSTSARPASPRSSRPARRSSAS